MAGAIVKSILEEALEQLGSQSVKKQSIVNGLKKRGVKDIELEQSGAKSFIDNYEGDKVPAKDLLESIQLYRSDNLESTKLLNGKFKGIREQAVNQPKFDYNIKTQQFEPIKGQYGVDIYSKGVDHNFPNHFNQNNYYSHVRYTDIGKERIVHEIQSDVQNPSKDIYRFNAFPQYRYDAIYDTTEVVINKLNKNIKNIDEYDIRELLTDFTPIMLEGERGLDNIVDVMNIPLTTREAILIQKTIQQELPALEEVVKKASLEEREKSSFKQEPNYLNTTINKMLVDAANEGKTDVKVRITPDASLKRSDGVQRWYETDVTNRLKKTAKQIGAETEMTSDGYFKLKLPPNFKVPLYAATGVVVATGSYKDAQAGEVEKSQAGEWTKIQEALEQGYSKDDIVGYLQKQGSTLSADELDEQVVNSVKQKIKEAQDSGYNDSEIQDFLITNRYDKSIVDTAISSAKIKKSWKAYEWDPNTPVEEAKDLADLYKNIYGKYSTTGKQIKGFFDDKSALEARREINSLNLSVATKLQEQGINAFISPETGEIMMTNEQGIETEVDSSILNDLYNSKLEFAGSIGGAIAGAKKGADIGTAVGTGLGIAAGNLTGIGIFLPEELVTAPVGGAIGRAVGAGIGTLIGGGTGAGIGKAADMTINALKLKENIETELYLTQMKEAAIFDGVATVIGGVALKGASGIYKQIMKAYDFVLAGNSKGAYKALLNDMNISDDQAQTLVSNWEKLNAKKALGKGKEEKAISVITSTEQGAEMFVKSASAVNPKLANTVIDDINIRAKGLARAIDHISDNDIGALIKKDLGDYVGDVKDFYGEVKDIAIREIEGTDFAFDINKLAIQPTMEKIEKNISNPIVKERFLSYAMRISNASSDRSFAGLVDLRQAINDFKYSKSGLKKPDMDMLNSVLNKVDAQINKAVIQYMPDTGKTWINQFAKAKKEYSKMKQLETNVLFKAINRKGVTEEQIQGFAKKYINALDGTFDEVLDKLPGKTRSKAEGAIIKQLTDRYTLGMATDRQAVHFPMLANALKHTKIITPEAKYLNEVITEMSKVFKNDVNLSKVSGNIASPKFQSYLTTDPVIRAKYEIASSVFNTVKRFVPGKQANNLALLNKINKLLENPTNAKTAEQFMKGFSTETRANLAPLVKQLQVEMTKQPQKQVDFKNMYKQSSTGKFATTEGALGKGVYLVDKVKNPKTTANIIKQEVNMSRMASIEDISTILGREVRVKEIRNIPNIQKELLDRGFNGIKVDGKVMLFNEQSTKKIITKDLIKKVKQDRTLYRVAPVKEKASELKSRSDGGGYVYMFNSYEEAKGLSKYSEGQPISTFNVGNAKLLDFSDYEIQDKIFKDLFNSKFPPGYDDIEMLLFDVHEGKISKDLPYMKDKLLNYLKKEGYSGHSYGVEEAWIPSEIKKYFDK